MSVYFVHFMNAFLPLTIFLIFFYNKNNPLYLFALSCVGIVFAYFGFFISNGVTGGLKNLYLFVNIVLLVIFLLSFLLLFIKGVMLNFLKNIFLLIVSFCFGVKYFYTSDGFKIFPNTLLDSVGIQNFAFILCGILICIILFVVAKISKNITENKPFYGICLLIFIVINSLYFLAESMLIFMQKGVIETESSMLSFIAKVLHYNNFYIYVYIIGFALYGIFLFLKKIKNLKKEHILDIKFRKNLAFNRFINSNLSLLIISVLFCTSVFGYYDMYASKPLEIDPPTIVEPNQNDEFVFDLEILKDNDLHRFAYISDDGTVIRFFMLNRYEDKSSPVAVFDACMICGDKGYVKRDGELICIACNVRLFLPSVGKLGGCNPIPLPFSVSENSLTIKLSDIMVGTNYFSEVREKKVIDPISKKELINLEAKFNYVHEDRTYFFESEENRKKFINDPESYIKNTKTEKQSMESNKTEEGAFNDN